MEIKCFASSTNNCNLKYNIHSNCSRKTLIPHQQPRTHQRLIPLTEEIVKIMADFDTSTSDKQIYKTVSITSLVREEVQHILQQKNIRKEETDDLIKMCLKRIMTIMQDNDVQSWDEYLNEEINNLCGVLNEKLMIENIQILEHRITNVEKRLSDMMHSIAMLQSKNFKINTTSIKDETLNIFENIQVESTKGKLDVTTPLSQCTENLNGEKLKNKTPTEYDLRYHEKIENLYNLLYYKKSLTSLKLNKRIHFNPFVRPILSTLPDYRDKIKQKTTFIGNNI